MSLTTQQRAKLMDLAKASVAAALQGRDLPDAGPLEGVLGEKRGCFVTLSNRGRLRGCIGTFSPRHPLGPMVVEMAAAAARQDSRFFANPITAEELPDLTIEISVLSELTETSHPEDLRLGVDGIYIVRGAGSGCFLPEVATDMGWNAEQFLSHCCTGKAGLPPDAWRDPQTTVFLFTSEKFAD